jgi:hypothetical protein
VVVSLLFKADFEVSSFIKSTQNRVRLLILHAYWQCKRMSR